jgi:hypothetical protein
LVDPGAQQSDFRGGEVSAYRRHKFVVDAGRTVNQAALGALAGT